MDYNFFARNFPDKETNYSPDEVAEALEIKPLLKQLKAENIIKDNKSISFTIKSKTHETTTVKQKRTIPKALAVKKSFCAIWRV
jgi:ribosomal protein L16 Arg81 hydroxylase